MKLTVLGCGRWGSFISWYLNRLQHDVMLWGRNESERFQQLNTHRHNDLIELDEQIQMTYDLGEAVDHGEILLISISSQSLDHLMARISNYPLEGKTIVLCMKGLEEGTGRRLTEVVAERVRDNPIAIWVGPGHVQDFAQNKTNCMVIDSEDEATKVRLVELFSSPLIRFYYGDDVIGNEVGAASKNVIGIAAGMLDGLDQSSLKGALMSRGTREISRLIGAMGGQEVSAYGLSHLGDYEATVFSPYSHNRRFGEMYVQGKPYGELAEGVSTTKALMKLKEDYHVELPICEAVNAILNEGQKPEDALGDLFLRSLKREFKS